MANTTVSDQLLLGTFVFPHQASWSAPNTMRAEMSGDSVHVIEWHPDRESRAEGQGIEYADEVMTVEEWTRRVGEYGYVRIAD